MNRPISGTDVLKICNYQSNLLKYPELLKYNSIEDIMKHGACIILYEMEPNYGHWCCVFRTKNGYEFFDPYGYIPDTELEFIPRIFRIFNNEVYPHLLYLLYKSNLPIEYNHHRFQKKGRNIATCGRHVGMRLLLRKLPLEKYIKLFRGDADRMVFELTKDI